ncbi:MAG TPA: hypothetical protein VGL56_15865 [Fimbriimonadaceae bacterium]|jgi:hypothetical protein
MIGNQLAGGSRKNGQFESAPVELPAPPQTVTHLSKATFFAVYVISFAIALGTIKMAIFDSDNFLKLLLAFLHPGVIVAFGAVIALFKLALACAFAIRHTAVHHNNNTPKVIKATEAIVHRLPGFRPNEPAGQD